MERMLFSDTLRVNFFDSMQLFLESHGLVFITLRGFTHAHQKKMQHVTKVELDGNLVLARKKEANASGFFQNDYREIVLKLNNIKHNRLCMGKFVEFFYSTMPGQPSLDAQRLESQSNQMMLATCTKLAEEIVNVDFVIFCGTGTRSNYAGQALDLLKTL